MKYQVIVADPAWSFDDRLAKMKSPTRRGAASQYATMSVAEIAALDVASLADPLGCVLALWVPSSLLLDGLTVMRACGFVPKGNVVWVKTKKRVVDLHDQLAFGMGRLFRQTHEIALVGTSGKSVYPLLKDHSQRSVILAPSMGHSRKPDELQESLELMFPGPDVKRLEMFARRVRPGWTCIGDAIDGKDIRDAIQELVTL
jgi:N6-adenosine-specific RNA methylase IME4